MRATQGTTPARQSGVTLIELMITLAVLAILVGVAAPSFSQMRQNTVRRAAMDNFWHAIFLARSEAIKRNSIVTLCRSTDGSHCNHSTDDWAVGWLVFANLDRDDPEQRDADEPLLRSYEPHPNISITGPSAFSFRPYTQAVVNGTIVFCDARGASEARAIIISQTGRPRQSKRGPSNRPLTCP